MEVFVRPGDDLSELLRKLRHLADGRPGSGVYAPLVDAPSCVVGFLPGRYDFQGATLVLGWYVQLLGLGAAPEDVVLARLRLSLVPPERRGPTHRRAFWRGLEHARLEPEAGEGLLWACAQSCSLRRVCVRGDVFLSAPRAADNEAGAAFLADVRVEGAVLDPLPGQRLGTFVNCGTAGAVDAAAAAASGLDENADVFVTGFAASRKAAVVNGASAPAPTRGGCEERGPEALEATGTRVVAETRAALPTYGKPYLTWNDGWEARVCIEAARASGPRAHRYETRTVATLPADASEWQAVLDQGPRVYVVRPGAYLLPDEIVVRAGAALLGLGFPRLRAAPGRRGLLLEAGAALAGVVVDASAGNPALVQLLPQGRGAQLFDVTLRVAPPGGCDALLLIEQPGAYLENVFGFRDDSAEGLDALPDVTSWPALAAAGPAGFGAAAPGYRAAWARLRCPRGLVVTAPDVLALHLVLECLAGPHVDWSGEAGRVVGASLEGPPSGPFDGEALYVVQPRVERHALTAARFMNRYGTLFGADVVRLAVVAPASASLWSCTALTGVLGGGQGFDAAFRLGQEVVADLRGAVGGLQARAATACRRKPDFVS